MTVTGTVPLGAAGAGAFSRLVVGVLAEEREEIGCAPLNSLPACAEVGQESAKRHLARLPQLGWVGTIIPRVVIALSVALFPATAIAVTPERSQAVIIAARTGEGIGAAAACGVPEAELVELGRRVIG